MRVKFEEFFDGPFNTQQDAFLDCQSFVECELDEMTEVEMLEEVRK